MELRSSSRSRSKTPFTGKNYEEKEESYMETGKVTRITRSSYRIQESNSAEITQSSQQNMRQRRSGKYVNYKTSDYSSEDGDNEVSSTHIENTRNALIEGSRQSNGNGVSALKIYREAQQYWNRYPKTDYTYSPHSKDRVELAPGVYNMPNMSRRSIHEMCETDVCHKETNTDTTVHAEHHMKLRPRSLFHENNNYKSMRKETVTVYSYLRRVFLYILTYFYALDVEEESGRLQKWTYSFSSFLHKISGGLMLKDTWILRGNGGYNKSRVLAVLFFLPLLLFGGLWSVMALRDYMNNTDAAIYWNWGKSEMPTVDLTKKSDDIIDLTKKSDDINLNQQHVINTPESISIAEIGKSQTGTATSSETVIKIQLENPPDSKLSKSQLESIANSLKTNLNLEQPIQDIMALMLKDSSFKLENNEKVVVDNDAKFYNLRGDLEKLKLNFEELRGENLANSFRLTQEMRRCCRRSHVEIEKHVKLILNSLLENPIYKDQILGWLNTVFVAKNDLEKRIGELKFESESLIEGNSKKLMDEIAARINLSIKTRDVSVGELPEDDYIKRIVKEVLEKYDADRTGLVDYALESGGGEILSTRCTEQYQRTTAVLSVLGVPIWYPSNTPRVVITQGITPGECWAFQNFPGYIIVRLSTRINVEAFSYEHLNRKLVPSGRIDSAPKNFSVYGLTEVNDKDPLLLGDYIYDNEGEPLQFFPVQAPSPQIFDIIELRISSNHGNLDYTCLYRFRVHGNLYKGPT